jgi:hypothetical protein
MEIGRTIVGKQIMKISRLTKVKIDNIVGIRR